MATIRKRNGKWHVQVRRAGHPTQTKTFLSKPDAQKWGRMIEGELDKQVLPFDPKQLEQTTVAELLTRYRNTVTPSKRGAASERKRIDVFMRQEWAALPLSKASAQVFSRFRDQRLKVVQPGTVIRDLGLLRAIFETAIREWSLPLPENPLAKVRKPKAPDARERRLEAGELDLILQACEDSRNDWLRPAILFAIETGMRRGELYIYTSEHSDRDEKGVQERQPAKRASANHAGLKQARIAVCTHELLLREHRLGIDLGIRRHNGMPRCNILIDEYLALVSGYSMAPSDLKHLGEQLSRLNEWDGVRKLFQSVENRVQALFEKDGGRAEKVEIVSREEYQALAALDRSGLGTTSDAERVGDTLRFLDAASQGQCFLYRGTGKRTASIRQAREFHAFDRSLTVSPGMIILDATFDVSPIGRKNPA